MKRLPRVLQCLRGIFFNNIKPHDLPTINYSFDKLHSTKKIIFFKQNINVCVTIRQFITLRFKNIYLENFLIGLSKFYIIEVRKLNWIPSFHDLNKRLQYNPNENQCLHNINLYSIIIWRINMIFST